MKRARVELEPVTRDNHLLLKRQRARHALERYAVDVEYRKAAALKEVAAKALEERAKAEYMKLVAEEEDPDADTAVAAAVQLVEATTTASEADNKAKLANEELKKHNHKVRTLIMKQTRERSALVYALGANLKDLKADGGAVAEGEEPEQPSSAAPQAAVPTPEPKGGVPVSFTSNGTMACGWCGSKIDKLTSVDCSECHRSFCGFGGTGLDHPRGGPCVDLYQCSCKSRLCHECYMATAERRSMHWRFCESCGSWMCVKETSGRAAACKYCSLNPICRSCRGHHEKTCTYKHERKDSDDEDEFSEEEDD